VKCGHNCGAHGLKGLHIAAQGNALGHGQPRPTHRPVRAGHFGYSRHDADTGSWERRRYVMPLQGGIVRDEPVPRALPWAVMLLPLSGRSDGKPNITGTSQGSHQAVYNYRFGDKLKDVASNFPGEAAAVYYQYDGLGKRRNRTLDMVNTTWWRWDLGYNVIQEYADADSDWDIEGLSMTYIPGLAEVPGTDPSTGGYRYYMGDHLGSVRGIRAQDKSSLASYEYMPYGEAYNQTGLALNRGFTGHTWDKDDGLYYAPYRYYNPVASRWLTRDPLGMKEGPNLYSYVKDQPVFAADPLGLQPAVVCIEEITQIVLVCIGGICTYVMSQQCIKAIVNGQCVWIPTGAKCGEDPCLRGGSNPNDKDECEAAVDAVKANCKYGPTPGCLMSLAIAWAVCSSPPPDGGLPPGIP